MWLKLNLDGVDFQLRIYGYRPLQNVSDPYVWCRVDFYLKSQWLNYKIKSSELLESGEVFAIYNNVKGLLNDSLTEITELVCIEPDLQFRFHPKRNLREDPKISYVRPDCEIEDISAEVIVTFWNEGLTDNHLVLTLYRDDLEKLLHYLAYVMNNAALKEAEVNTLVEQGVFVPDKRKK